MKVNNKIKEIREKRGIVQLDMAAALGVSRQTMTAIENMKYNPSLELTLKIAKYFNLPVEEIFELVEED
ncbi:helix-turn-helix transcriptional regulator [Miniphocaeibacter halophilus]|uniref:Helix-turn-helix transcriptional regulator n=1 Tax=Miniphocaeibacter halophilus TaxID=2931922 RepID=A0AC61MP70_9FIRM|nr:helix-turn-helix transcriptional regulator [Miniphocaeibacter halophilus]QQK07281.1 helix-turn-helix transcriptional regulator [Miniphocaeibacter halophilus]